MYQSAILRLNKDKESVQKQIVAEQERSASSAATPPSSARKR
jgi:hypothetical protein